MFCLMLALACQGQTVNLTTLEGETLTGELSGLTQEAVTLRTDGDDRTLPTNSLMQLEFVPLEPTAKSEPVAMLMTLRGQTSLAARSMTFDGTAIKLDSHTFGELTFPVRDLQSLRIAAIDARVADAWRDLEVRTSRDDLLVFRKGDVLDYVSGSIGSLDPSGISIRVRDRDLQAPLDRVFGVVFAQRGEPVRATGVGVTTVSGDSVKAQNLALEAGNLQLTLSSGTRLVAPITKFSGIDFGGGRIRFLTELPGDEKDSRSPNEEFPVVWFTSANSPAGSGGRAPLTLGERTLRKGLWLHSGANVRYRVNREFSRFRCLAGFELSHVSEMPRFEPRVRLVILGDGKELYSREFSWNEAPQQLELTISDVRELVIRVESLGKHRGILEHFALGDAQVIQ